jgi:hypothetical protein
MQPSATVFSQITSALFLAEFSRCSEQFPTARPPRGHLSRTNLAYANRHRDWRLFQAVAQILMRRAARLYQDHPIDSEPPRVAFALDSSIISLSLNLFPWGYYARSRQAALKLHLMLSLQGNLPAWGAITEAGFPDMNVFWPNG